ncbi:MAG: Glu-tRNA(Gln) amidotransferase subunit GatE, partial [Methermicoccaceae archaeon]
MCAYSSPPINQSLELVNSVDKLDFTSLGLMAGLEIHQQLDTSHKLFCHCPTILRDSKSSTYELIRYLRASKGELGSMDTAASLEIKRAHRHRYLGYDTTCLVEDDEEPPTPLNEEALWLTLTIAKMLGCEPIGEVHTMRKTVVDGSNTTGFQRTALVALDGAVDINGLKVGIGTVCLEEEACQKIEERGTDVVWSLDRLGIPLVEICTDPDIRTPRQAREVAAHLGRLLRSTGKVKRGIGTIRQDVNISIEGGARVEVKGVQELDLIETLVAYEAMRQHNLIRIRDILNERG